MICTLQYNTIPYNDIYILYKYNTIPYKNNTIQYKTIPYINNTTQHNTIQNNTIIQYNTTQYKLIQQYKLQRNTTRHNTIQLHESFMEITISACSFSHSCDSNLYVKNTNSDTTITQLLGTSSTSSVKRCHNQ